MLTHFLAHLDPVALWWSVGGGLLVGAFAAFVISTNRDRDAW